MTPPIFEAVCFDPEEEEDEAVRVVFFSEAKLELLSDEAGLDLESEEESAHELVPIKKLAMKKTDKITAKILTTQIYFLFMSIIVIYNDGHEV